MNYGSAESNLPRVAYRILSEKKRIKIAFTFKY